MKKSLNFNDASVMEPQDLRLHLFVRMNITARITMINEAKVFDCYAAAEDG